MKELDKRLKVVEEHIKAEKIKVMIIGLGSVGTYLLDYLVSSNDLAVSVVVVGRNKEKMEKNVNIVRIASLIREVNKTKVEIEAGIDFNDTSALTDVIKKHKPDFIVNSSRAYPGLKYGTISWSNFRAYGIWSPLSIRFVRNIMDACDKSESDAIVINTSYSDAVIPWMKSAGKAYPDFGSGNLNHLIPRIRFAVADILGKNDFWNVDVMFAAGHFHDVCISKEGQTEGIQLPLKVYYQGKEQNIDSKEIFERCSISMPTDAQRNMMNASSNYRIIKAVIDSVRNGKQERIFTPGVFGKIGGYPVLIGKKDGQSEISAWIDESVFSLEEMEKANRASLYLDGIEDVRDGSLFYTDELMEKVDSKMAVKIPKEIKYEDIDKTADYLIEKIIIPNSPA
ncbi:MAG: saccharopine dehydrogenase NADP-binding domain-containing protein [Lachnospiraceae bacterium]|nr:saccharopine dehydrogenase NADP-binding domain-containing protein [Lachnospiraceae bacterium]